MESFAHILILCLALLASSMIVGAHRNGHHHYTWPETQPTSLDVTNFGAIGNGKTDDSKAFQSAWKAACTSKLSNTKITVPGGKTFLLSPVGFEGRCNSSSITFEILGNITAPKRSAWRKKDLDEWPYFHQVDNLTMVGNGQGLIDGRGESWWKHAHSLRPTALRFSHCNKLYVSGLKHINSQKNHVSISACNDATISNLKMTAPKKSPNTDGIDVSSTTNLRIHDCVMETGDDCIAINAGTSNVNISNILCGPGHGISIGSLGKNGHNDEVEVIQVTNCTFNRTDNGVRIKTWQGGSGFARNISFSEITFIETDNPVIINQYYCPHKQCANKTSAIQVSDVRYKDLHGTSTGKNATINFSCSKTVPCTNIIVDNVNIKSVNPSVNSASAYCINAHASNPSMNCLMNDDNSKHEYLPLLE